MKRNIYIYIYIYITDNILEQYETLQFEGNFAHLITR